MENKYEIVEKLTELLKITNAGRDIDKMEYVKETEDVIITFKNGFYKKVNVYCDSGVFIIEDVIKVVLGY